MKRWSAEERLDAPELGSFAASPVQRGDDPRGTSFCAGCGKRIFFGEPYRRAGKSVAHEACLKVCGHLRREACACVLAGAKP